MERSELTFLETPASITISVLVLVLTLVLCYWGWRRSDYAKGTGVLELLRLMLVGMVLITLNQPEWVVESIPEEKPVIAVLWDGSASMTTRDVVDPVSPSIEPQTRAQWVAPRVDPEVWKELHARAELVIEPFSDRRQPAGDAPAALDADPSPAYLQQGTNLTAPLASTLDKYTNLRAVVVFSDGDWNVGDSPLGVATRYRTRKVPIYTVAVGSSSRLPDVEVLAIDAPTFAVVHKTMQIPYAIRSSMPRAVPCIVTLASSEGEELTAEVVIPPKGTLEGSFNWQAERPGLVTLKLSVPSIPGEFQQRNNELSVEIDVREEALNVLLIESFPRWEYRYFRNALVRDPGVEVSCLLFHPDLKGVGGGPHYLKSFPTRAELSAFDVVFLGDVGVRSGQLSLEDCELIKGLVERQASGLILMPGLRGYQQTLLESPLSEVYPVQLDLASPRGFGNPIPSSFVLTDGGRNSLLTKLAADEDTNSTLWQSLPGFYWFAPVLRAKAGTEVLAVHQSEENEYGRIPLLVTKPFGTGKVLFMGTDGAWRWREGVEDRYHYRFWGQVARWMAYQRQMASGESMRLYYNPDRPKSLDQVVFNANVMSPTGSPIQGGTVVARVESPSGSVERLTFRGEPGEWGLYRQRWQPKEAGKHRVTLTCKETGGQLQTEISVRGSSREKLGEPARHDVLDELSRVTQGEMVADGEFERVLANLAALPEPEPQLRRLQLWNHPLWGGLILLLLGVFWVGRKMNGNI